MMPFQGDLLVTDRSYVVGGLTTVGRVDRFKGFE